MSARHSILKLRFILSRRSSVEHAKLNPVFMQVCEEDGLTEGGKLVQDAIAQYTAVSKCSECGQSIKTKDQKKKKWPVMVRAIWRCYKGEVILIPAPLLSTLLSITVAPVLLTCTTPHQLIQAALWKLGWSIAIVTAIAYFIRNILLYINSNGVDTRLNEGIYLVTFFGVVIILLTIFLQQCMFISARLGIKIQVHLSIGLFSPIVLVCPRPLAARCGASTAPRRCSALRNVVGAIAL
jgi:hypothetical protein